MNRKNPVHAILIGIILPVMICPTKEFPLLNDNIYISNNHVQIATNFENSR